MHFTSHQLNPMQFNLIPFCSLQLNTNRLLLNYVETLPDKNLASSVLAQLYGLAKLSLVSETLAGHATSTFRHVKLLKPYFAPHSMLAPSLVATPLFSRLATLSLP